MSISVSGGAGSFDAHLDDMLAVSSIIKASGSSLRELSDDAARASVNGSVLAAGLLCPVELAAAEAAILRATTGPDGLLPTGLALEGSGLLVEAAVTSYRVVDGVGRELLDHAQQVVGMVAGGVAVVGAIGAASYLVTHPLDLVLLLSQKDSLLASVQTTLFEHPWLMDAATRLAPGFLQGALMTGVGGFGALMAGGSGGAGLNLALLWAAGGHWPTTDYEGSIAGLIALGQKFGYFHDVGDWPAVQVTDLPDDAIAPDGVRGIFEQQGSLGRQGSEGQVQIVKVVDADGTTRWIVQIPGTQDWSPERTDNPVDLTTNVTLMSQEQRTAMQREVERAMAAAGIGPNDEVMLTGHSQGGITAAAIASDATIRDRFNVVSVVTGGSPIARMDIPDSVSVLSVEHAQDPVPKLDGATNPATDNWVTVHADVDAAAVSSRTGTAPTPGDAHGTNFYATTGQAIDSSSDPSATAWRDANAQFFNGTTTVTRWQISG
jgi:hypothetical protein